MLLNVLLANAVPVRTRKDDASGDGGQDCGYKSCPEIDATKNMHVHLVPHSHDDMGWLKNIDEYNYGIKNHIQRASVQYILDSVVKELYWDPNKR